MIRDHHNEIALDNVLGPFLLLGRFPNVSAVTAVIQESVIPCEAPGSIEADTINGCLISAN